VSTAISDTANRRIYRLVPGNTPAIDPPPVETDPDGTEPTWDVSGVDGAGRV
jgi:hypothetical protein